MNDRAEANARYIINILRVPGRGWRYQVLDQIPQGKRTAFVVASGFQATREAAYDKVCDILRNRASEGR